MVRMAVAVAAVWVVNAKWTAVGVRAAVRNVADSTMVHAMVSVVIRHGTVAPQLHRRRRMAAVSPVGSCRLSNQLDIREEYDYF
jgi:hypothetical protein